MKKTSVIMPTETNCYYCPNCNMIYDRDYPAHIRLMQIDDDEWCAEDIPGKIEITHGCRKINVCDICKDDVIPIYTNEARDIVDGLCEFGFDIIGIYDRKEFYLNGSINMGMNDPLYIEFSVPELKDKNVDINYNTYNLLLHNINSIIQCSILKRGVSAYDIYSIICNNVTDEEMRKWKNAYKQYVNAMRLLYGCKTEIADNNGTIKITIKDPRCASDIFGSNEALPNGVSVNIDKDKTEISINKVRDFNPHIVDRWFFNLKQRIIAKYKPCL